MALGITASLVGVTDPRPVQVEVTGLTIGVPYTVTASSGTWSRVVRGADAREAEATTELLVDVLTPLNAPLTYTVTSGGSSAADVDAVTVAWSRTDSVVHSLDRSTVAGFDWVDNGDPRTTTVRAEFFEVSGRARPVMVYDDALDDSGTLVADTSGADTAALRALIRAGAPVVMRTDLGVRDVDPVDVYGVAAASRALVGAVGTIRRWDVSWRLVDDDMAARPFRLDTFDDFNAVYSAATFADVNVTWSGMSFADVNALDWAGGAGRL